MDKNLAMVITNLGSMAFILGLLYILIVKDRPQKTEKKDDE